MCVLELLYLILIFDNISKMFQGPKVYILTGVSCKSQGSDLNVYICLVLIRS